MESEIELDRYVKLRRAGVPLPAVQARMRMDGVDEEHVQMLE